MKKSPFAALTAILAALLASGLLVADGRPALAHDSLKSSSPAKGAEVESLDEVRLEFTARVRMPFVVLRGPDGAQYQAGEPEQEGAVVRQAVKSPLPGGKYTLAYRVVSSDGHPIEGEIPFTVKAPAEETPTASAEPSSPAAQPAAPVPSEAAPASSAATDPSATPAAAEDGGPSFPVWLIIVIGALVGIGIGFLFSARKSKP